nr:hypothetical protein Iba_chr03cCG7810 [Ipomoea batatas]
MERLPALDGLSLCSSVPVGIFHGNPILLFAGLHACIPVRSRIRCSVPPVSTGVSVAQFLSKLEVFYCSMEKMLLDDKELLHSVEADAKEPASSPIR